MFLGGSDGKETACNAGDPVWSLGGDNPLEKGMAPHSSIFALRIPWTEEPGGLQSMEWQSVRHDWVTNTFTFFLWRLYSRGQRQILLRYTHTLLYCALQILHFFFFKTNWRFWQPCFQWTRQCHLASLCHILVILGIFQTFSLLV